MPPFNMRLDGQHIYYNGAEVISELQSLDVTCDQVVTPLGTLSCSCPILISIDDPKKRNRERRRQWGPRWNRSLLGVPR